jgi:hypothetical protein
VSGTAQEFDDAAHVFFLDEDIVGVVGADGEDGDTVAGKRLDEGEQDSGLRKQEWAFELEARPAWTGGDIFGKNAGWADDGEFVGGAGDGGEVASDPVGRGSIGGEAEDGVGAGESAEFEAGVWRGGGFGGGGHRVGDRIAILGGAGGGNFDQEPARHTYCLAALGSNGRGARSHTSLWGRIPPRLSCLDSRGGGPYVGIAAYGLAARWRVSNSSRVQSVFMSTMRSTARMPSK